MSSPSFEREYFTLYEVSEITGKSYSTVYRAAVTGELNALYRGRRWTVHYTAIHEWLPPEGNSKVLAGRKPPAPQRPLSPPMKAGNDRLEPAAGLRLDVIEAILHALAERMERLAAAVEFLKAVATVAAASGVGGPEMEGQYFSMQQVAQMSGRSFAAVHKALITGRLTGVKGEYRWYIPKPAIAEWLSAEEK